MRVLEASASPPLRGSLQLPGDKSISQRALMLASIAEGQSAIQGLLHSGDTLSTLAALRQLGAGITVDQQGNARVQGVGLHGLRSPDAPLDLGNSATAARILPGLLAGQGLSCRLCGDRSLQGRPMRRVLAPLARMGARITASARDTLPLDIAPAGPLKGICWQPSPVSAQVKSALLLAGLYADSDTTVIETSPTRDHTERLLTALAHAPSRQNGQVRISPARRLRAARIRVPGDLSSAAFFIVAASLIPGSLIRLQNVGVNPHRDAVVTLLRQMGADIEVHDRRCWGNEPVADIEVRAAALHGIDIPQALVPGALDEFPALLVAAAFAEGRTTLSGAGELRVKESDRLQAMASGFTTLGIAAEQKPDGMVLCGGALGSGRVDSRGDHRIAMALAVAGACTRRDNSLITVENCSNISTSFPEFVPQANALGLRIRARG